MPQHILRKKRSRAKDLLLEVALQMENALTLFEKPWLIRHCCWDDLPAYRARCERRRKRDALYRLKQQQLLKTKIIAGKLLISLTETGKTEILRQRIISTPKRETGDLCLVTFDIPETQRKARDFIRHFLKGLGFERVHLSVWATEKDVATELTLLLKRIQKYRWVRIYDATERK